MLEMLWQFICFLFLSAVAAFILMIWAVFIVGLIKAVSKTWKGK